MSIGNSGILTESTILSSICGDLHSLVVCANGTPIEVFLYDNTEASGKVIGYGVAGGTEKTTGSLMGSSKSLRFCNGLFCQIIGTPGKVMVGFTKG